VLKIDGTIIGNLIAKDAESTLILDDEGNIEGEVRVPTMIINGTIKGNVYASDKIDLYPKAQIMGDVHYNLLEMEVGAEVNGRMVREEVQSYSTNYEQDASVESVVTGLEEAES
jgi:cytoskeletal protein CcmA (bactofilin family)